MDNDVKRKRGRPKGAKNILKLEYQDELSWEDIQAIEKLNKMSVQASARFLLLPNWNHLLTARLIYFKGCTSTKARLNITLENTYVIKLFCETDFN